MKPIHLLFLAFFISACGQSQQKDSQTFSEEKAEAVQQTPQSIQSVQELPRTGGDSLVKAIFADKLKTLNPLPGSAPYYTVLDDMRYYILSRGSYYGKGKVGLANEHGELLLPMLFDKIYNPNASLEDCFEIKKGPKVGMFNYKDKSMLEPRFDFILPTDSKVSDIAYGYLKGQWYEINSKALNKPKRVELEADKILGKLSFGIDHQKQNLYIDSYRTVNLDSEHTQEGTAALFIPSYLEYFDLFSSNEYLGVIAEPGEIEVMGTESIGMGSSKLGALSDNIFSFLLSAYEQGIDARGYEFEKNRLVTFNKETNALHTQHLYDASEYDYFCKGGAWRQVNDSILEISENTQGGDYLYNFEPTYGYFQVLKDGSIKKLESERHFNYTQHIYINGEQFVGCFAKAIPNNDDGEGNMWVTDHLSIEDLDMMRNEIFASYGYKFKSAKWQDYFKQQEWYRPRYDNVDDQLTEIDKANIRLILEVKQAMEDKEETFTKPRKETYVAAG